MDSKNHPLKVHFVPFYTPSHSRPLADLATQFAARGCHVTIITTHYNSLKFQKHIDKAIDSGHHISIYNIKFPSEELGLPEGVEDFVSVSSPETAGKVYQGFLMLQNSVKQVIQENPPHCLVADSNCFWAYDVASELGIPNLVLNTTSFFALCAQHCISLHQPHKNVESDKELFVLPGLPHEIKMTRLQLPDWVTKQLPFAEIEEKMEECQKRSYGNVVNSFYELEKENVCRYKNIVGNRVWSIGPLWHFNRHVVGAVADTNRHSVLKWLDSQKQSSVLYISFGTLSCFSQNQLFQIALALESLDQPFVWVVRESDSAKDCKWLPERFEEKMMGERNKGLIIRGGWAPQTMILEHPATGGFVTHCGWNSILESISLGVPMVTWPLSGEQFYNEKLVSQVLRIGVEVGVHSWTPSIYESRSFVEAEKIEKAVRELMNGGEEAIQRRQRAKEFSEAAKIAVQEGGSSSSNLTALLDELQLYQKNKLHR